MRLPPITSPEETIMGGTPLSLWSLFEEVVNRESSVMDADEILTNGHLSSHLLIGYSRPSYWGSEQIRSDTFIEERDRGRGHPYPGRTR
ncbi:MAG: hypothetical protein HQL50_14610 [Magnetococcales bacterium]|nr:hypothetical protein [Magnetococcales bacterium]